jgi:hypothetical protein
MTGEWESTLAGTFRRAAAPPRTPTFPPAPAGAGLVAPLTMEEADAGRIQHEHFERAWEDVLSVQNRLAAEGWPGAMVTVESTVPAPIRAMRSAIVAAQSVVEVTGPGEASSAGREAARRMAYSRDVTREEEQNAARLAEANARMLKAEGRWNATVAGAT